MIPASRLLGRRELFYTYSDPTSIHLHKKKAAALCRNAAAPLYQWLFNFSKVLRDYDKQFSKLIKLMPCAI